MVVAGKLVSEEGDMLGAVSLALIQTVLSGLEHRVVAADKPFGFGNEVRLLNMAVGEG